MTERPTRDDLMIPILRVMQDGESRHRSEIFTLVADLIDLPSEQRSQQYDNGGIMYDTDAGFVLSYLTNVGALDRVSQGNYQIKDAGRSVLEKYPVQATEAELEEWAKEPDSPIHPYQRKNSQSESESQLVNSQAEITISKKFELASLFRERVLENNRSFLWPEDENVWTPENAQVATELTQNLAGLSYVDAFAKLVEVAKAAPRPIFQIICDVRAVSIITRSLSPDTANRQMSMFFSAGTPFDGDQHIFNAVTQSSADRFPGIPAYHNILINQVITLITGISACIRSPEVLGDRDRMCEVFVDSVPEEQEDFLHFPIWTLFFLMYPIQFASVPTWSDRQAVLRAFTEITASRDFPNQMAQLAFIREQLDKDFDPYQFDFYEPPWREKWSRSKEGPDDGNGKTVNNGNGPATHPLTITDLVNATFLDKDHLEDIENLLRSKKQLIFEGPPGSGKTFVAEKFARYFAGQPLTGERNGRVELVQFHQSYSYEDFVEGIRPETKDGQLHYNVKPGIFREFATKAWADRDNEYVLIIDEINRGNVSRILGELMLLLEYREEKAKLPYSQEYLEIPPNLYIIGTMNSADRSLSQIDYALRRRFYFVRFLSVENGEANVLSRWLNSQNMPGDQRYRILRTFIRLNSQLRTHLETDDLQIGHSYFMNEKIGDEDFRKQVWQYAVIPLIREYLYHHRDKDELLKDYELRRFMEIVQPIADDTGESTEHLINESAQESPE